MATTILKVSGSTGDWFQNGNDVFDTISTSITASTLAGIQTTASADGAAGIPQGAAWRAQVSGYGIGRMVPESGSFPGDFSWTNVTHVNVRAYVRIKDRVDDNHVAGFFFGNVTGTWGSTTYEIAHTNYSGTVNVPAADFTGASPSFALYESGNVSVSIGSTPAEPAFFIDTVTNSASMANDGTTVEWDAIDVVLTYTPSAGSTPVTKTYSGTGTLAFSKQYSGVRSRSYAGTGTAALSTQKSFLRSLAPSGTGTAALAKAASRLRSFAYSATGTSALSALAIKFLDLIYSAIGSSALTKAAERVRSFSYGGTGTSALAKFASRLRSFSYSGTGTNALSRVASYLRAFSFSATGTALLSAANVVLKSLDFSATGTSALTRVNQWVRSLAYSASGSAALANIKSYLRSLNYSATGSNALSSAANFLRNLSYSVTGSVSFANVFVVIKDLSYGALGTVSSFAKQLQKNLAYAVTATTTKVKDLVKGAFSYSATGTVGLASPATFGVVANFGGGATLVLVPVYTPGGGEAPRRFRSILGTKERQFIHFPT